LSGFQIVVLHRPMKCRSAIGLSGIDVDFLLNQRPNGIPIGMHCRIGDTNVNTRGAERQRRKQHAAPQPNANGFPEHSRSILRLNALGTYLEMRMNFTAFAVEEQSIQSGRT
jgi:hypothetical protein